MAVDNGFENDPESKGLDFDNWGALHRRNDSERRNRGKRDKGSEDDTSVRFFWHNEVMVI